MPRQELVTITCPGCGRSLPPKVLKCHFCGSDLAFVGRPEQPKEGPVLLNEKEVKYDKWYRFVAYYWVVDGALAVLVGLKILPEWASGLGSMLLLNFLPAAIATGFLISFLGIGMLIRLPMARWLVRAICIFRLLIGLTGIGVFMRSGDFEMQKHNLYVLLFLNLLDTAFAAFQLWLLYETDYEHLN